MSRALMASRCPGAQALGIATLAGWRFLVNPDRVGSIAPAPGNLLWGVLWRLSLRDLVAINAYESVDTSLYLRRILPVSHGKRRWPALVYLARRPGQGRARPGYIGVVVAAAREWNLPDAYIDSLQRWSPSGWAGVRAKDTGELG
jgi:AIG2-like family